jgi:hypothetical protein
MLDDDMFSLSCRDSGCATLQSLEALATAELTFELSKGEAHRHNVIAGGCRGFCSTHSRGMLLMLKRWKFFFLSFLLLAI